MFLYYISGIFFFMFSMMLFYLSIYLIIVKMNYFMEWYFIYLNSFNLNMYIYIDWMSMIFISTVLLISSMIMFYCIEYMNHDMFKIRFFWILFFFIMSMILMILSPNILTILIGWDGLGLSSYCLIIHYQSKNSFNSGMLTVLINRMGDIFIIMSISMMMSLGSWNLLNFNKINIMIIIMLILAAMTKSAQFPFSSWLPAAMAAPTPVSSLVHSSTLVTAGIYMMIRFNHILIQYDYLKNLLMMSGLITMLMAGISANFEFDLKKIIAYSTLSQLGLMMMILSMNYPDLAFFHLITHAMFKSMMFMSSGIIIHSMNNYQDIRYLGKIKDFLPMTSMMMMISNFSLCGLPFFSGFYSKDLILENLFKMNINLMIFMMLMISTILTVLYSFRLFYYLMNTKMLFIPFFNIKEFKMMNFPMIILMIMSIKFGMIMNWLIFNNIENIFLLSFEKILILLIIIIGMIISKLIFKLIILINKFYLLKYFMGKMWFLYKFNYLMIYPILSFGKFNSLLFDKGWSEEIYKNYIYSMNKNFKIFNLINLNYFINLIMMLSYFMMMMFLLF